MKLLYVADPMCSWCWGFSPVVTTLAERFRQAAPIEVVMGGLRPGTTDPMTEDMKSTISEHWRHVEEASGQPFDFGFFDRESFVYDTEPASRAVVTARGLDRRRSLAFLSAVQGAFYRDARDVTDPGVLADIAAEEGFDRAEFERAHGSAGARDQTASDFDAAGRLGVRGFPTLLGLDGRTFVVLTAGFRPLVDVLPIVEAWLADPPALPAR
ncbi:MAG: DsbA family protein [Gemmatimonadota bacterium]